MTPAKVLVIEAPYKSTRKVPWSAETVRTYEFLPWEAEELRNGEIVWRDGTAFMLEDE